MPEPRKLRVFLCHASQDKPGVRELYQRLLAEGWINNRFGEAGSAYGKEKFNLRVMEANYAY